MTMEGYVSADGPEPRLTVDVLDRRGTAVPVEVVIDTGFTGFITLPIRIINALGLEQVDNRMLRLADGRSRMVPAYLATVVWHGIPRSVRVITLNREPLIGMSLLWNSDLAMSVREGGRVLVTQPAGGA